jgi:DnaJ-class molecular chaperone
VQEVEKAFKPAFDTLADLEKRERLDMQLKHSADSQKRAMDIASGRDEKLYEAAKELEAAKDPSLAFKKAAEAEETLQAHFTEAAQDGYDPPAPDEDTAEDEIGDGEDIRSLADEIFTAPQPRKKPAARPKRSRTMSATLILRMITSMKSNRRGLQGRSPDLPLAAISMIWRRFTSRQHGDIGHVAPVGRFPRRRFGTLRIHVRLTKSRA